MSVQVQHRRDTTANIEANIPAAGELWFDTQKEEIGIGNGATAGGVRLPKKNIREILAPAQIVANTNDYNPTGQKHAAALRLTTDASRNLTGLVPTTVANTTDGRQITLYNAGAFNLVVQDQNASSSAANRFDLGGADITLSPKQSITLRYSNTLTRWEIAEGNFGQAVSDAAVSARKLATSSLGAFVGAVNATIVESHVGNAVTYALKTLAGTDPSGTDPVLFTFQNGSGGFVVRSVTAALSLTISAGSSMGFTNAVPGRIWIIGIDTGAGVVLGSVNVLSGVNVMALHQGLAISTTAEGGAGAADNAQVIYSAAAQASKFMCLLAYADYDSGVATAGNWTAAPTRMVMFGSGVPRPGEVVQPKRTDVGTVSTGTTQIPIDNTIPQNTEGDQYMSLAITASAIQNLLRVKAQVNISSSASSGNGVTAALFQDSIPNALKAAMQRIVAAGSLPGPLPLSHAQQAGGTLGTAITFKVRAGPGSAVTLTFNGEAATQDFGGVINSYMEIEEIMA